MSTKSSDSSLSSFSYSNFYLVKKFQSVHVVLSNVRSWDTNIKFFLTFKFLKLFNSSVKNKLFNKIKKFILDKKLILQLKKIIHSGFVDFSNEFIYSNNFFGFHSNLSRFFLELLLSDFDKFVDNFDDNYMVNSSLSRFFEPSSSLSLQFYNPLKINKVLKNFNNLKSLLNFRSSEIRKVSFLELKKNNLYLNRFLYRERFIDNSIIGILGSKSLVSVFRMKIEGFVRSQMLFDFQFSETFSSKEPLIFFAGFNIRLC